MEAHHLKNIQRDKSYSPISLPPTPHFPPTFSPMCSPMIWWLIGVKLREEELDDELWNFYSSEWVVVKTYLTTECDDPKAKRYIGSHVVDSLKHVPIHLETLRGLGRIKIMILHETYM